MQLTPCETATESANRRVYRAGAAFNPTAEVTIASLGANDEGVTLNCPITDVHAQTVPAAVTTAIAGSALPANHLIVLSTAYPAASNAHSHELSSKHNACGFARRFASDITCPHEP